MYAKGSGSKMSSGKRNGICMDPKWPAFQASSFLNQLSRSMNVNTSDTVRLVGHQEDDEDDELSIEECTDRETLLKLHAGTEWGMQAVLETGLATPVTNLLFQTGKMGLEELKRLRHKKRVTITSLTNSIDRPLKRKFFLCRTLTKPIIHVALFQVVCDEPCGPDGGKAALLICALHKNPLDLTEEEFLPIGTFIVIKDPMMTRIQDAGYTIRCLNQKDMFFVRPDQMEELFPAVKWEQEVDPYATEKAKADVVLEIKNLGNSAFAQKQFIEAIDNYENGLAVDPKNLTLLSNRAACYLNLRCYRKALADAETVLGMEPFHWKCIYRKVKSQWGLQKYRAAVKFIRAKLIARQKLKSIESECVSVSDLQTLLKSAERVLRQSETGKDYDMEYYLNNGMQPQDVGEFVGNVKVSSLPGGGPSLVATEDIEPGQLLLCSKAFSVHFTGSDPSLEKFRNYDKLTQELVNLICFKLQAEPESKEEFYKLPKPWLERPSGSKRPSSSEEDEMQEKAIPLIITNCVRIQHSLAMSGTAENEIEGLAYATQNGSGIGLFTLPSFANDGCFDANSSKFTVADLVFIRAVKTIRKGEEILICRNNPLLPYKVKRDSRGSPCKCTLCCLDSQDSEEAHERRNNLIKAMTIRFVKSYKNTRPIHNLEDVELLVGWITTLRNLRPKNPELNIYLVVPVHYLAESFYETKEFVHSITLWKEAYGLVVAAGLGRHVIGIGAAIVDCYILLDLVDEVLKWVDILKKDLMLYYGYLEALRYYEPDILENMQRSGIRFL